MQPHIPLLPALLALLPTAIFTHASAPPITGSWTLTSILTSGPDSQDDGQCATCWPGPAQNTVAFTIWETNTTCTTTWLPPNKPIGWVDCEPATTDGEGSGFAFKFPVGEDTRFFAFTPVIQYEWVFPVGPVGANLTESEVFNGQKFISETTSNLFCLGGAPGTGLACTAGPVSIEIGS